jgi:2-oxoglutarate dehydrogenase E2 component (dihydrolipoamide succinyltransferase)
LGDTSTEGFVVEWLKSSGDAVEMGDPVCTISQDKANFEIECPYDGTIESILVQPDVDVEVGVPIARIRVED